jgi:hypothetical protein
MKFFHLYDNKNIKEISSFIFHERRDEGESSYEIILGGGGLAAEN